MARTGRVDGKQLAGTFGLLAALLFGAPGCASVLGGGQVRCWVADELEDVARDSEVRLESDLYSASERRVRLTCARRETIAVQLVLSCEEASSGVLGVRVGPFAAPPGPPGGLPAASLFHAEWADVSDFPAWYPRHTRRPIEPREVIDVLRPLTGDDTLRVAPGRNEVVWIDIATPADATPGLYQTELSVADAGGRGAPRFRATIEMQVVDAVLPAAHARPIVARLDPTGLLQAHLGWPVRSPEETVLLRGEPSHDRAVALVDAAMRSLRAHGLAPVLWASFPKFTVLGPRDVAYDWEAYDALVAPYLAGDAFDAEVGVERWPLPLSTGYPDAVRNGGLDSPAYGRLLGACLRSADAHFNERGWGPRAFARLAPPGPLTVGQVKRVATTAEIARAAEVQSPLLAFLPPRSPRGLGWHAAPAIGTLDVGIWCPPAMLLEPAAEGMLAARGAALWFQPEAPPYGPSLAIGAPAVDPAALAWVAAWADAGAVWLEQVTDRTRPLLVPGRRYRSDGVVPTARLKRLRRGAFDADLLDLVAARGGGGLAEFATRRIVRWAGAEVAMDNLVSTRPTGWARDPGLYANARAALRFEAAGVSGAADAVWRRVGVDESTEVQLRGARLSEEQGVFVARMSLAALNQTRQATALRVTTTPPDGWSVVREPELAVGPGGFAIGALELATGSLTFNGDGLVPLDLRVVAPDGVDQVGARVAVTSCPLTDTSPRIDGAFDDWRIGVDNQLGDFRLVHPIEGDRPVLPTRAAVNMDSDTLYFAIEATLQPGDRPVWSTGNVVPVEGAMPWGEEVVEILLSPTESAGDGGDLYVVQIKPSGLVIATRGARTEPPMNAVVPWVADIRCATRLTRSNWTTEVAIPFAAFGPEALRSRIWGANVTRLDARRGEYASWSGARGQCYAPERLGNLILLWP